VCFEEEEDEALKEAWLRASVADLARIRSMLEGTGWSQLVVRTMAVVAYFFFRSSRFVFG